MNELLHNISNDDVSALPMCRFGGRVEVIDNIDDVNRACDYLISQSAIGFDTETRPSFKAGVSNKVALLQLSSHEYCFLFRLSKMRLDKAIIKVLESRKIAKVGAAIRDDLRALQTLRHFKPDGFVDLQTYAAGWGIEEKSVRKMAGIVLGHKVSKAQRLSNWEASELTSAQISYAATDAWVCLEIYDRLNKTDKK